MSKHRVPISWRLSITLGLMMMLLTVGLTILFYAEFVRVVDLSYSQELIHSCNTGSVSCDGEELQALIDAAETEEYKEMYSKCRETDDWVSFWAYLDMHHYHDGRTLHDIYDNNAEVVRLVNQVMPEESATAYIQYMRNGKTYNLMDMSSDIPVLGQEEEPVPAFEGYKDNEAVPPMIYKSQFGYLYSAITPIIDSSTGENIAQFCVDVNYDDVIHDRRQFLFNILVLEIVIAIVLIAVSIWRSYAIIVRPLKKVAAGAASFGIDKEGQTSKEIIDIKLKNNDEISDLYNEIRQMQSRIIDNTEYITRVTAERERMQTEMDLAAKIQSAALPKPLSENPSFKVSALMTPAKSVGGDFYDFFMLDDDHLALLIADVSDKGVPAALFMMSAKIRLRTRAREGGTPAQILTDVNSQLFQSDNSGMFVTVWLGILDINDGNLICSNAGHEYPFLRRKDAGFSMISDKHGPALGMFGQSRYQDYTLKLAPEDVFFTYTDGVAEANKGDNELFGLDRTRDALNSAKATDPESIIRCVSDAVNGYLGDSEPYDDVTMLCVMYMGSGDLR